MIDPSVSLFLFCTSGLVGFLFGYLAGKVEAGK